MNTLKIQNRELLVKLTERCANVEALRLDLATSEAKRSAVTRNLASFSIFMTQVRLLLLLPRPSLVRVLAPGNPLQLSHPLF